MTAATLVLEGADTALSTSGPVPYAAAMTSTPDDASLMLAYRDGDARAFETLYRRHNDSLYRYLLRLCRNRETAEDLFQEVWAKIVRARHRYEPTAKFSTFLYRVARNSFIDYTRRTRNQPVYTEDPDTVPTAAEPPDELAERRLARERLEQALATLPDEQRDVFLLHEEAGLNLDAIATVTGANRETVKSRLRYAVAKLREALRTASRPTVESTSGDARESRRA